MTVIRKWIWEMNDQDKYEVMTGHGLLKPGDRENGSGMNRGRNGANTDSPGSKT